MPSSWIAKKYCIMPLDVDKTPALLYQTPQIRTLDELSFPEVKPASIESDIKMQRYYEGVVHTGKLTAQWNCPQDADNKD